MSRLLVIGGGGREHALSSNLASLASVSHVFVSPGNGGTASTSGCQNIDLNVKNFAEVTAFCKEEAIDLVCVGPEDPLAAGIVDHLKEHGIKAFGPLKAAARLESSKSYSKDFMRRHGLPTAAYATFIDNDAAQSHIRSASYKAWVVKASGLAAGKGVTVADSVEDACQAANDCLVSKRFGAAGSEVVVEELLEGEEISALCFTDGQSVKMMPLCQDHKRLLNGDQGPNTGGMGAYAPYPLISPDELNYIEQEIMLKTIRGLKSDGIEYTGVLYAGLMRTSSGLKILEFNCRFGDPETQVILPLLQSDLYEVMLSCCNGTLADCTVHWAPPNTYALSVVVVSEGYPGVYAKGSKIDVSSEMDENITLYHAGTAVTSDGDLVTSGGRVMNVVALCPAGSLKQCHADATRSAALVRFEGARFRTDIGWRIFDRSKRSPAQHLTYAASGVNVDEGNALVGQIKAMCSSTRRPGADGSLDGFGGIFDLKSAGYHDPVLVAGTDGVGTKLRIAIDMDVLESIGIDLVAMCVNDVLMHAAEPLFFLDYFATGRLDKDRAARVVAGIAEGCRRAECSLIGGETAEMPGFYGVKDFDIAGFCVGAKERDGVTLPNKSRILPGDVLIGVPSSGVHSNGFSLVRAVLRKSGLSLWDPAPWDCDHRLGHGLLKPTQIYARDLLPVLRSGRVKAAAHITGGGLVENVPRVLPPGVQARLDADKWTVPEVFKWLSTVGCITADEMCRTFNMGLGVVLLCDAEDAGVVLDEIRDVYQGASIVGCVEARGAAGGDTLARAEAAVHLVNVDKHLSFITAAQPVSNGVLRSDEAIVKKRVAVLISGSGSNLQALIDHCRGGGNAAVCDISLVVSNVPGVKGIQRARDSGIPVEVLDHKDKASYPNRAKYDEALSALLKDHDIDLVCLAGFMRILTESFCREWCGRVINVHPSLLPSFKGAHAVRDALAFGVQITGCTVHFAVPDVDSGAIIMQQAVPVLVDDSEESLLQRMHSAEHSIFPRALDMVASKKAQYDAQHNRCIFL